MEEPKNVKELVKELKSTYTGRVFIWCFKNIWVMLLGQLMGVVLLVESFDDDLTGKAREAALSSLNETWINVIIGIVIAWIIIGFYVIFLRILKQY